MRVMFYGLQNSGATLLALLAGQRHNSIVIPDLWTMHRAPVIDTDDDVCIKVTVTAAFPLREHIAAFKPDHVFLVVRRPVDNLSSLRTKPFARHDGTLEEKFAIADEHFAEDEAFEDVLIFEDFVADPDTFIRRLSGLGWHLPPDAGDLTRTPLEMEQFIWRRAPQLYERAQWGTGHARLEPIKKMRLGRIDDQDAAEFTRLHCPHLHAYYERRLAQGELSHVALTAHMVQDEAALQARGNFLSNCLSLFEGLIQAGDVDEALRLADELCRLAPDLASPWNAYARALDRCGRHEEAGTVLLKALSSVEAGSSAEVDLRVAIASHAWRIDDLEQCTTVAGRLAGEYPDCTAAHQLLADVALREQRFADAQQHALNVLSTAPRSVSARRAYAEGLYGEGRLAEALDSLRSCLAFAPDFQQARRMLERWAPED